MDRGHSRLLGLLSEVRDALLEGHWSRCLEVLERLIVAFECHLRAEEEHDFPSFAQTPQGDKEVERLLAQHWELRVLLGELSSGIRARSCETAQLDRFIAAWRVHDRAEAELFHRWLHDAASAELIASRAGRF